MCLLSADFRHSYLVRPRTIHRPVWAFTPRLLWVGTSEICGRLQISTATAHCCAAPGGERPTRGGLGHKPCPGPLEGQPDLRRGPSVGAVWWGRQVPSKVSSSCDELWRSRKVPAPPGFKWCEGGGWLGQKRPLHMGGRFAVVAVNGIHELAGSVARMSCDSHRLW